MKNEETLTNSNKRKLPEFAKVMYWISGFVVILFGYLFFSMDKNVSIEIKPGYSSGFVMDSNGNHALRYTDDFIIVEKGFNEGFALLGRRDGKLYEVPQYLINVSREIFKITPHKIIPIRTTLKTFLLNVGLINGLGASITNPPNLAFILLPLLIALISHFFRPQDNIDWSSEDKKSAS